MKLKTFLFFIFFTFTLWGQTPSIVTVLTFNILHGATSGTHNLNIISNIINKIDPDFVALQEVDSKTKRAFHKDITKELGKATGMHPLFGKAITFDNGEYGVAVLSKNKIIESENYPLPYSNGNEARTLLSIKTILNSGDTILFCSTHLNHLKSGMDRVEQAKTINKYFEKRKQPAIIAGDFNDIPNSETINILENFWTSAYNKNKIELTFPSNNPTRKIDYVMFYPQNLWQVIDRKVICDSVASDHCAYLVKLKLLK